MKKLVRVLLYLFLLVVGYVAFVLIYGTINDYKAPEQENIESYSNAELDVIRDSVLSFAIWNIGYSGLGAQSDFFYAGGGMLLSGGHDVRPTKALNEQYLQGIKQWFSSTKSDFFLLQEVDRNSKRSYKVDHFATLSDLKKEYFAGFGLNYRSPWVPLPLFEPWNTMGKVESGLGTYARFQPTSSNRYQLPGEYSWPTKIFQLDRCAAVFRFPHVNGKELVVINVHNSAFDKGGVLKKQQMDFLKEFFLTEYEKGNYVIAGGDWNQCPPFFRKDGFKPDDPEAEGLTNIESDFMPSDWTWAYDPTMPTNRSVTKPLDLGNTFVTLIDFFLVSPNVNVLKLKGMNLNFASSDHQPLYMEVEIR
ncbi:MAG: endonuclease/exonuclease/phosphatase family protein [Bacteroidota bacterium]